MRLKQSCTIPVKERSLRMVEFSKEFVNLVLNDFSSKLDLHSKLLVILLAEVPEVLVGKEGELAKEKLCCSLAQYCWVMLIICSERFSSEQEAMAGILEWTFKEVYSGISGTGFHCPVAELGRYVVNHLECFVWAREGSGFIFE